MKIIVYGVTCSVLGVVAFVCFLATLYEATSPKGSAGNAVFWCAVTAAIISLIVALMDIQEKQERRANGFPS